MARRETKHFKALYFDLRVKDLEQHYSKTNPRGAYKEIQKFLLARNFHTNSIPVIIQSTKQQTWRFLI